MPPNKPQPFAFAQRPHTGIAVFDIDGVVRDVSLSYRRAIADTVEHFTKQDAGEGFRPAMAAIDELKAEGVWNNDWEAAQELVYRHWEGCGRSRSEVELSFEELVAFFQARYLGADPENWNGYIVGEPVLVGPAYWEALTRQGIAWGFFSGAPRDEAAYVLARLGLTAPVLVAMHLASPILKGFWMWCASLKPATSYRRTCRFCTRAIRRRICMLLAERASSSPIADGSASAFCLLTFAIAWNSIQIYCVGLEQ